MTYAIIQEINLLLKRGSFFRVIVFIVILAANFKTEAQQAYSNLLHLTSDYISSNPTRGVHVCDSLLQHGKLSNPESGIVMRRKGQALYLLGKFEDAGTCFSKSIQYFETGKLNNEIGLTLIEQARLYRKLKMYQQAIDIYSRAFKIFEQYNDRINLSTVLNEWGVVYEMKEDYQSAINYYNRSLEIKKELKDTLGVAYSYGFLSYVNLLTHNYIAAEDYGKKSFSLFQQIKTPIHIALQSTDLSVVYQKKGDYQKAIHYLNFSDSIAEQMNYADLKSGNYERLAGIYALQHRFDSAYDYLLKFTAIKDSLFSVNSQKNIAELNIQYKTSEKDKNIALQKANLSRQRLLLVIAAFLLLLTVAITGFIYRNKKQKEAQIKKEAEHRQELLKMEALNSLQQERLRISRDLHDNIGSYLTYIKTNIDDLAQTPSTEQENLVSLKELTAETISELRRMVWLINKPAVLLEEWIIRLREHFKGIPFINILSSVENSSTSLTALEATMLFRILQEATNNALKYARSSNILIQIKEAADGLNIKVSDNGIGFDLQTTQQGFGLSNMKQRAKEINAELSLESHPGKGTSITIMMNH